MPVSHKDFMRDILANPGDDVLRLMYADWLSNEENDCPDPDPARADFIRKSIAYHVMSHGKYPFHDHRGKWTLGSKPLVLEPTLKPRCPGCRYRKQVQALADQTDKLLADNHKRWEQSTPQAVLQHVQYIRGFVGSVRCPIDVWLYHGGGVVAKYPLWPLERAVHISNRIAATGGTRDRRRLWYWERERPALSTSAMLPAAIFNKVETDIVEGDWKYFAAKDDADIALSVACVLHAQEEARECEKLEEARQRMIARNKIYNNREKDGRRGNPVTAIP